MPSEALLALDRIVKIFERLKLRYVVGGSLASATWGEPRSTNDVDLLLELIPEAVPPLFKALRLEHYVDLGAMEEALEQARAFNIIHLGSYQKVDVFVAGASALDRAQLEYAARRILEPDLEREFFVTAAELIVLRKLDWFRRGGGVSDRQWRDVLAVLRIQSDDLNRELMHDLAGECDLTVLLGRALQEALGAGPEGGES